jgi:hypothetical protein
MPARAFILLAALALSSSAFAQSVTSYTTIQLKGVQGTLARMTPEGLVVKLDGKLQPIAIGPGTDFTVQASGDLGFLQAGAAVTVHGERTAEQALRAASIEVHLSIDSFRFQPQEGNIGITPNLPPVPAGSFVVEPTGDAKDGVRVILGRNPSQAKPDDRVVVYYEEQNPAAIHSVTVIKNEELKSTETSAKNAPAKPDPKKKKK